jgi:hypothetical protein
MRVGRTLQLARDMLRGNRFSFSAQKPAGNSLVRLSFMAAVKKPLKRLRRLRWCRIPQSKVLLRLTGAVAKQNPLGKRDGWTFIFTRLPENL